MTTAPVDLKKKKLVLFDFDGTITTRDTLVEFLRYYRGTFSFILGMIALSPTLLKYTLKLTPNWEAKQKVLQWFIGGEPLQQFEARCKAFSDTVLPALIRPRALETIKAYTLEDATVVVVSASAENWIGSWCESNGILCLATQLEVADGKITGRLCGENCFGPAKVKRIQQQFKLSEYGEIIAYGDSDGDRDMLALAHRKFYKPFRERTTAAKGSR